MEIKKEFRYNKYGTATTVYDEPSTCPICKHSIKPVELLAYQYESESSESFLSLTYLCPHCYQTFVASHRALLEHGTRPVHTKLLYIEPNRFAAETFEKGISDLSPQFVKIYNQALAAECAKLDEIAGLGYRKSLEFLIKDFCIHLHPNDEEKIKSMPLAKCITTYVDNDMIKTLAERSAWLGNDEAHYIRKHTDRDVNDMKAFIKAMVYFVGMVLITEDAASMSPA